MVSSPSCRPLSKATACSSFVAWCPALGEYCFYFFFVICLKKRVDRRAPCSPREREEEDEKETDLGTVMNICLF